MIIYKLTSPSGKSYIGKTKQDLETRFKQHVQHWKQPTRNYKSKLYHAFEKYPPNTWTKEILHEADTPEELNLQEIHYIDALNTITEGYNTSKGGDGRTTDFLQDDHKTALSKARSDYYQTEAGQKWKEELSLRMRGNTNSVGKSPWNKGKKMPFRAMSDEQKAKISASCMGRKVSPNQRKRIAQASSKNWRVTHPCGKVEVITNLQQFCREQKLCAQNLGTKGKYKGYRAEKIEHT